MTTAAMTPSTSDGRSNGALITSRCSATTSAIAIGAASSGYPVIAIASEIGVSSAAALRLAPSQARQAPATRTTALTEAQPAGHGLESEDATPVRAITA